MNLPEKACVEEIYLSLRKALAQKGVDSSALDARLLIMDALDMSHTDFIANPDRRIKGEEYHALKSAAMRRMKMQPVSQICGRREFYGRDFIVSSDTLTPRPDSEVLIEVALAHLRKTLAEKQELLILDLGTGGGCLLLTLLLECEQATGIGIDMSGPALDIAKKNAQALGLEERSNFINGNWFDPLEGKFDLVISNPPYIPTRDIVQLQEDVRDYEPHIALDGGADGLTPYRAIIPSACQYLHEGGALILELGQGQYEDVSLIFNAVAQNQIQPRLSSAKDLEGRERCLCAVY